MEVTQQRQERKTFRTLYDEYRQRKQPTLRQQFLREVAQVTCKSPQTVEMWIYGTQAPDQLTREQIAKHFGVEADSLFPTF